MFRFSHLLLINLCLAIFLLLCIYSRTSPPDSHDIYEAVYEPWHHCVSEELLEIETPDEFWEKFPTVTTNCEKKTNVDRLGFLTMKNKDETKYAFLPKKKYSNSSNVFITLGIGKDISAEKQFEEEMQQIGQNVDFYGADPITDTNADLYGQIGKYFPFAIGGKAGFSRASVLIDGKYTYKSVIHVELLYFLQHIVKLKTIDHLWFDAEGAEYDLFDIFYKNGPFEQNDIVFCQMNLEVHMSGNEQKKDFMIFIKKLIAEKRIAFLKNYPAWHMRMYLFNFGHPYCINKFLSGAK